MGASNQQIDKVSKELVKLSSNEKKFVKREHKRLKRRKAKDIDNPDPQYNRYNGYIG